MASGETALSAENEQLRARLAAAEQRLRPSERKLAEAGQQQTATAEVLRIVASSPTQLDAVLRAILGRAGQLVGADAESGAISYILSETETHLRTYTVRLNPGRSEDGRPFMHQQRRDYRGPNFEAIREGQVVTFVGIDDEARVRFPDSTWRGSGHYARIAK